MKISLITVCYNSAAVIRTALESVLRQTWPEVEYWVVDGGSTDGTLEIIREYEPKFGGRMRWVSEPDRGMYDAINKGIRLATGEVVGILNADDVLADDRVLERVAGYCDHGVVAMASVKTGAGRAGARAGHAIGISRGESPEEGAEDHGVVAMASVKTGAGRAGADVLYGDIRFVADRRGIGLDALRAEPTVRYYSSRHWRPWMLQWGFMPPHPSVYIRRECFERLGDYALDYRIAADYALLVRFLRKARLNCRYVPMCFVDMRVGGMSTRNWRSNLLLNREIVRGNREAGYFCCLPMLLPKYAFKVWEFVLPRLLRPRLLRPRSGRNGECKNMRGAGGDARGA
ncbi:MAG: glycosyltransferase family 2 protein [Kiritimatiellia bacterium]|jgi:glycosyltransferase involved in cell wall biosynthesis|nr:glycosyltransferase family 2 protein [Kiritimatiellia bacterium]